MRKGQCRMSAVFDIILIMIVAVFIIIGAKKGFVRSVSGFLIYIFAFNIANAFYIFLAKYTDKIAFIAELKAGVGEEEIKFITEGASGFIDRLSNIGNYILSGSMEKFQSAQGLLNFIIGDALSCFISFIAVFIAALLVLKLLAYLLNSLVTHTLLLRQINGALGGVFGALCGLFWAWVFAKLFVSFVFPILNSKLPEVFVSEMVESTVVKLCLKINPLAFLMYAANWFAGLFR